jgi:predicted metal-dependent hydrolase
MATILVRDIPVEVTRKNIKNLHVGVYPPNGRVRVAAPLAVSDEAVRLAVVGKLAWIRRQREAFQNQPRQTEREAVSGESHYVFGRRYLLRVVSSDSRPDVSLPTKTRMELSVRPGASTEERTKVLDRWYRLQLRREAGPLIEKWQTEIDVSASFWGIKRMKTKWGSCNHETGRIWINSELAKKPVACLEYIIVHELLHLIEPKHSDTFVQLMEAHLPDWQARKRQLNSAPLSHEDWSY